MLVVLVDVHGDLFSANGASFALYEPPFQALEMVGMATMQQSRRVSVGRIRQILQAEAGIVGAFPSRKRFIHFKPPYISLMLHQLSHVGQQQPETTVPRWDHVQW